MTTTIRQRALPGALLILSLAVAAWIPTLAATQPPALNAGGTSATGATSAGGPGAAGTRTSTGLGGCVCDDNDACTEDTCDAEYQCHHTPIVCDDGLRCTDDICDPSIGCVYTPLDCSTGNVCITQACIEATGTCVTVGKLTCGDRNACTVDSCDPELGCFHAPVRCDDQNPCTRDACVPALGCVHRADACGGPIDSAPGGSGTEPPTITASAGDTPAGTGEGAATRDVPGSERVIDRIDGDGGPARARDASRDTRRAHGGADLCAFIDGPGIRADSADPFAIALTAAWPSGADVEIALAAACALDAEAQGPPARMAPTR